VLADEFRDGNVPGDMAPLNCAWTAFAALPRTVTQYAFRGDTACYEGKLLAWLDDSQRADGRRDGSSSRWALPVMTAGPIDETGGEKEWVTQQVEEDGTLRQWADLDYVPSARYEQKGHGRDGISAFVCSRRRGRCSLTAVTGTTTPS